MEELNFKHKNQVWLIIPAFNEEKSIGTVVSEVVISFSNIVVVDDGSTDDTSDAAFDAGAIILVHPVNLGQGAALQTGLEYAIRKGAEVIVTFDADGQHKVKDAIHLANSVLNCEADIVCGSRFLGIEPLNMPFKRKLLIKMATLFTRIMTGVPVTDAHNGLRAISRNAAKKIAINQNGMAHATEIIFQLRRLKLRYIEKPVEVIYSLYSLKKGQKNIGMFKILLDLLIVRSRP